MVTVDGSGTDVASSAKYRLPCPAAVAPVENPDPLFVAKTLAAAIRKLGTFDVVMTGREAGDWGAGQTGGLLAEELGIPCVSFAESLEPGTAAGNWAWRLPEEQESTARNRGGPPIEVMPNGKAPVLGTGKSRFDSGHLDSSCRSSIG